MPKIKTFLTYVDQAEEAANLYVSIFPNSRVTSVTRYGDAGPGAPGSVMTISFELDGKPFVALNGGPQFTFSQAFSLSVECETQGEIDAYWDKLTANGGKPVQCGWLTDRFGVSWQIVPAAIYRLIGGPDREKSQRAMRAMMQMVKFDIAALERAYEGDGSR